MSHTVTFNVRDENLVALGCDALFDHFTASEFNLWSLTGDAVVARGLFGVRQANSLHTRADDSLYFLGTEDVAWVEGYKTGAAYFNKEADHIFLYANNNQITVVTDEVVDLTNVDYLYIDWRKTSTSSWDNGCRLVVSPNKNNAHTDFTLQVSLGSASSYPRQTSLIDVRDLSGDYYIRVHAFSTRSGRTSETTVYNVYYYTESATRTGVALSPATSLSAYGVTGPNLKVGWRSRRTTRASLEGAHKVVSSSLVIERAITDSDLVPPDEGDWVVQQNRQSIAGLPADLTGKYLWFRATLTSNKSYGPIYLDWLVVYDNADSPLAAVRIDFNDEIKAVPATGTVDFDNVDPAVDIPYIVYVLGLIHDNIFYDEEDGTVTVVAADVTENVTLAISAARVTQFYMEVAIGEDLLSNPVARITQFYLEIASPHWEYDVTSNNMRIVPKLSAPLFGLDLPVEALSMRIGPVLSEAPLYVAYVLDAEGLRLLQRTSEARINTQGLCIFYSFVGELCILETVEAKHSINEELELDEGIYVETSVYDPFIMQAEVVWPRQLIYQ